MELHAGAHGGSAIIFAVSDWFQPPGQFYQLLLTVFGRCEQYTIDSMVYMIGNEAARATGHLQAANKLTSCLLTRVNQKQTVFTAIRRRNS